MDEPEAQVDYFGTMETAIQAGQQRREYEGVTGMVAVRGVLETFDDLEGDNISKPKRLRASRDDIKSDSGGCTNLGHERPYSYNQPQAPRSPFH
jgi:hypothetical protein